MLGSINPLGERGRRSRWALTVAAYLLGSLAGGTGVGAALGAIGSVTVSHLGVGVRTVALAATVAVGVAWEAGFLTSRPLPGPRRQVDEDWLVRYRGWVYGVSFGFQLGLGVATIVTTASVYAALAAALLTGSVVGGAVVGAVFGLARALPVLGGRRIRRAGDLLSLDAALRRWDGPARAAGLVLQLAVAAAAIGSGLLVAVGGSR